MPPTETKSYTPGAERAAKDIWRYLDGTRRVLLEDLAEIISRETHDAEMLEALKRVLAVCDPLGTLEITAHARAVIAKAEGR